jgi:hypothetical protein
MGTTEPDSVESKDKSGKVMKYVKNAPVCRVNIRNIQNILDRSSKEETPRLKIINNEKQNIIYFAFIYTGGLSV